MFISFLKQERKITAALIISALIVILKISFDNQPQPFPHAGQIVELLYDLALATIAAIIFYFMQFFQSAFRIRKIALIELSQLIARSLNIFQDIFISTLNEEEYKNAKFSSLKEFLSSKNAEQIGRNFNLEVNANYSPTMSWANRLALFGQEIKEETNNIAAKYSPYLTDNFLIFLHELNRNIFVAYILTLNNHEATEFMKKYRKFFLPVNVLEDFFELMVESVKVGVEISFSDSFLKSQKGLLGKARL